LSHAWHGPKAIASGSPDVFFDGLAPATKGDTCTCGSALASSAAATVFIGSIAGGIAGGVAADTFDAELEELAHWDIF
jgi:hypothetical protein